MQKKLQVTKQHHLSSSIHRSQWSDFFIAKKPGRLDLGDGTLFRGQIPANQTAICVGEVVFNTGMTGYVESLTDPSYAGQILVFTFPLIGNYGVDILSGESQKIQVSGVIVSEVAVNWSAENADRSLLDWLHEQQVPILMDVDTRALTKHLRTTGTMHGSIGTRKTVLKSNDSKRKIISIDAPVMYNETHKKKVILVDCGAKENIVRMLCRWPVQVKRVPYDYDYTNEPFDGVLLSNGPGDPTDYTETVAITRKALDMGRPVFGICLGTQIMALAAGATTYKLKYGHRGHNQPCFDIGTNKGYITSQNHGYAIDEKTLPRGWKVSFKNLNDGSVEGIAHKTKPFFSVQFHPEASAGPTDTTWLFERFYTSL